jgi:2-polyprenyl-3-methyl-5-hydroxy-6-metoxy-1,4-benzoquinol methylase
MDACSEIFIGKNFDAIYCGDVIEHVNDPVKLLRFISRHLNDDGAAILSTPNPFYSGFNKLRALRKESFYTPNLSHISWITPANMLEICYRSGLFLETIYIPEISRSISVQYNYALELAFHEYIFLIRAKVR